MAEVTVCIPAYRAAKFINRTLESVRLQTFGDFHAEIAIEPADADTQRACEPFLADRRFAIRVNGAVLGWDRNIAALLSRVASEFFVILPHDDMLHPRYLEILLPLVRARTDASVAYGDIYFIGEEPARRWLALDEAPLAARLQSFFLGGGEAVPWRGVTPTRVFQSSAGFPFNEYAGFAVETEWALHLLLRGPAIRAARPLYFKRRPLAPLSTVSSLWAQGFSESRLRAALEHNRGRMLGILREADLAATDHDATVMACEAAMLRRTILFSSGRFPLSATQVDIARDVLARSGTVRQPLAARIGSMAELCLSHHASILGNEAVAEQHAHAAVALDPEQAEGFVQLGRIRLQAGDVHEALELAVRASSLAPLAAEARVLLRACEARLTENYAP